MELLMGTSSINGPSIPWLLLNDKWLKSLDLVSNPCASPVVSLIRQIWFMNWGSGSASPKGGLSMSKSFIKGEHRRTHLMWEPTDMIWWLWCLYSKVRWCSFPMFFRKYLVAISQWYPHLNLLDHHLPDLFAINCGVNHHCVLMALLWP